MATMDRVRQTVLASHFYKNSEQVTVATVVALMRNVKHPTSQNCVERAIKLMVLDGLLEEQKLQTGSTRTNVYRRRALRLPPLRTRSDEEIGIEWPVRTSTLPGWR